MPEQKKHLSASQINTYLRCPMQYYFRYIKDLKLPPKSALTLGSSVHAGLAHNYQQKKDSHKDLKVAEVIRHLQQSEVSEDDREKIKSQIIELVKKL